MSIKPLWTGAVGRGTGQDWALPCLMAWLIINPLPNYEMAKTNEISATRFLMSILPIPLTPCLCPTNDNICMCRIPWSLHNTWIWKFVLHMLFPLLTGVQGGEICSCMCLSERLCVSFILYLTTCCSVSICWPYSLCISQIVSEECTKAAWWELGWTKKKKNTHQKVSLLLLWLVTGEELLLDNGGKNHKYKFRCNTLWRWTKADLVHIDFITLISPLGFKCASALTLTSFYPLMYDIEEAETCLTAVQTYCSCLSVICYLKP